MKKGCGCLIVLLVAGFIAASIFLPTLSKKAAEQVQAAHDADPFYKEYGEAPTWNTLGGDVIVPAAMKKAIRANLKDPDSFKPREAMPAERTSFQGVKCYKLTLRFSARNGFGGMTEGVATAYMHGSQLLDIKIAQ